MKKSYIKFLCAVMCAVLLMPMLFSCASDGSDGMSAYDIAVKNGFVGTEEEWLLSLTGKGTEDDSLARAINQGFLSTVSITTYAEYGSDDITSSKRRGVGSGFFYSIDKENGNAYIITNYHVVYDENARFPIVREMYVSFYGLDEGAYAVPATFVGGSATFDIAVIKIENCEQLKTGPWKAVSVRSSAEIMIGETVFAVGDAKILGLSSAVGTVTQESLTKLIPRADGNGDVEMRIFRTDAPINGGNSGGPVFDKDANVVGVVVAKNSDDEVEGIGYIIPSDIAIRAAANIIDGYEKEGRTTIKKCLLGVTVTPTSPTVYVDEQTGAVRRKENVTVLSVTPNSASQGKIFSDDIILAIESESERVEARLSHHLIDFMLSVRVGDTIKVELERDGQRIVVEISFTEENTAFIE